MLLVASGILPLLFLCAVVSLWTRKRQNAPESRPPRPVLAMTQAASRPVSTGRSWTGVAVSLKVGPYVSGADVFVDLPPGSCWPREFDGKRVMVTGTPVIRYDLPVFIEPDRPLPQGAVHGAGIPVPNGTDLHKASRRVVIENARWALAPDEK